VGAADEKPGQRAERTIFDRNDIDREVGTFTGYSALAMALALPADGRLVTCDTNESWAHVGRKYWNRAGIAEKIELRIGPAVETMERLEREGKRAFDMIFVDANKDDYGRYYEASLRLVRRGGLIILEQYAVSGVCRRLGRPQFGGDHSAQT